MRFPYVRVPREAPSKTLAIAAPMIAIVLTLIVGAILFGLMGTNPVQGLRVFLVEPITTSRGWGEVALKATPLILCAVGLAMCFRANIWNIGAEGQLIAGAIAAGGVALFVPMPAALMVPTVLVAAATGGAFWASIVAWLRDRFNASEILVSLMLVYVAQLALAWLVQGPWRDRAGYGFPQTELFNAAARIPILIDGSRVNVGFIIALIAAFALWTLLAKTVIGFELRVAGLAPRAARYAGFSERRLLWLALLTSGAMAGVAGGLEAAGPIGQLTPSISPGYGFAAIIVAFMGRLNPLGIVLSAFVMALFFIGGELAQSRLGLPSALTGVYQGLLLFFLLACDTLISYRWQRRPSARTLQQPA